MSGEPRVSEPAPKMASDTPQRRKVLVVDDDPAMCLMVRATLEGAGFLVRDANGGGEALSVFETLHPDIVLLDVMMPDMNGFATCQALRRLPGGAHIPIVMLTGLDDSESIEKAYSVGATDFVTKPIAWPM